MTPVRMTATAVEDERPASSWYRKNRPHLESHFKEQLRRLRLFPNQAPESYGRFRRVPVPRTCFVAYYTFDGAQVVVQAVLHGQRDLRRFQEAQQEGD